ncbi:MAG: DUF1501 domain-containing protein [Gemmataceae bacterium]|nr:DUF1501 domain-containing protein [Gemmataceae bacterium]
MNPPVNRRNWLQQTGCGFGLLAGDWMALREAQGSDAKSGLNGGIHHRAKVKRVIQLFMNGGVSQMDTFDYKPELEKRHGQPFKPDSDEKVEGVTSVPGNLMKSPFPFKQHGQCGRWVSSVFPNLAKRVDDMAFLMSVASKTNVHGPASYMMNTGFALPGFPALGAWLSFGLGRLGDNLPTFVVLPDARGLPYNQKGNFSAGFLPSQHQGTILQAGASPPIHDLFPSEKEAAFQKGSVEALALLQKINREHAAHRSGDSRLEARLDNYLLAARMQQHAPEALDLTREPAAIQKAYGLDNPVTADFGKRCLLARRLVERGVRFVQVWSGAGGASNNWDNHTDIIKELPAIASQVDQPAAALLADLKQRGLLDDTLLMWNTEFGRHPFTQGATGRDHNMGTSVAWLAGAGIKHGSSFGESDPWAWRAAEGKLFSYDIHATLLYLMGIDHEKLTVRNGGADRRLTDVHGKVVQQILA